MDITRNLNVFSNKRLYEIIIVLSVFLSDFSNVFAQEMPEVPRIKYIRLHTGNVEIAWDSSITSGIEEYTVWYKFIELNDIPDWTKPSSFTSVFPGDPLRASITPNELGKVNVLEEPVAFGIQAEKNGQRNIVDDGKWLETWSWDSSMILKGEYDTCLSQVELSWTPYDFNAWEDGLWGYRIVAQESGGKVSGTFLVGNDTSYTYTSLEINKEYDIYVAAVPLGRTEDYSTSTSIHVSTYKSQEPEYIYADYATYSNNKVELNFTIDPDGELTHYKILRSNQYDDGFVEINEFFNTNSSINYIDDIDFNSGPYYYKLQAINNCGIISNVSNTASSVLLSFSGDNLNPTLSWNSYQSWLNGVSHYSIERKMGDSDYEMITQLNQTTYSDNSLEQLSGAGMPAGICYRIIANEFDNILGIEAFSQSNEICFNLPVNIIFEFDAFTPGNSLGNNTFGPSLDFIPDQFDFKIINRSGAVVFHTTDALNPRWDGRYNGQLVPQGAYMYVCWYKVRGGKKKVVRGGVAVVYP